jgi:N-methylhydantoinase A
MSRQAIDQLAAEGIVGAQADVRRFAALHYKGQTFELVVPVPAGSFDARMVAYLEEAFGVEHEKTYGHRAGLDEPVELVSIQVVGSGLRQDGTVTGRVTASRSDPAPLPPRRAYFGDAFGWIETSVLRRSNLTARRAGPLIIEEYDATCLIPPGAHCHLDTGGNMVIEIG